MTAAIALAMTSGEVWWTIWPPPSMTVSVLPGMSCSRPRRGRAGSATPATKNPAPARKLTNKEQRELETLPAQIEKLEAEQAVSAIAPAVAAAPDRNARRETVGRTSGVVGTFGL